MMSAVMNWTDLKDQEKFHHDFWIKPIEAHCSSPEDLTAKLLEFSTEKLSKHPSATSELLEFVKKVKLDTVSNIHWSMFFVCQAVKDKSDKSFGWKNANAYGRFYTYYEHKVKTIVGQPETGSDRQGQGLGKRHKKEDTAFDFSNVSDDILLEVTKEILSELADFVQLSKLKFKQAPAT